ncbi:MAG: UPF0164 family protein [Elusimicrobiales bacterium]|nr:UPF0164 family protein [Elusimicrobiales bacterium]
MRKDIFCGFLLTALFLGFTSQLTAQESGVFLKLPVSARAGGMGDSFAAIADEPFGAYYNPAGIAFFKHPEISFVHHVYLQDVSGNSVALTYPFKKLVIDVSPSIFKTNDEPVYDSLGNDTGDTFGYQGSIIPVTAAYRFGALALGVSFKSYSEKIADQSSRATVYDAGAIYRLGGWRIGAAAQNYGGTIFGYKVAKVSRFGIAYGKKKYLLAADFKKEGEAGNCLNAGGEVLISDSVKLRSGWRFKEDFGGLTFGLGLGLGKTRFDYAFLSYGDLGTTHKAGVSFAFGAKAKDTFGNIWVPNAKVVAKAKAVRISSGTDMAVAEFTGQNVSQADAAIVANFLRTELVSVGLFNVMDRANMDTVLAEQKFQNSGCTEQECAAEMGKLLNVKLMLVGSLSKLEGTYYVSVNVLDVETGKIIASYESESANSSGIKDACRKIVKAISR